MHTIRTSGKLLIFKKYNSFIAKIIAALPVLIAGIKSPMYLGKTGTDP